MLISWPHCSGAQYTHPEEPAGRKYTWKMATEYASALIVATPGRLRDGWQALLMATHRIKIVGQTDNAASTLEMIAEQQPALVLLDAGLLGNDVRRVLTEIRAESPLTRCIVLADNIQQQHAAKVAGADRTLLKGFSASTLVTTIESLLPAAAGTGLFDG